ncbi:NosD domain-containing protein [Noviherbaspirillum pedocola]|uniref:Right-handed parallel beta-helix repeat-containing protein n=1 Tax=Noviherbaspirillum pedocola TaxID=2801341 RepID=A0A934STP6_9BURK|nr:NosD domain-containing protein [Noviherbaspirillum pedocola]MBK4735260.1 right-handed parallel beta-helix repeat-containing protein [Noviherbaspirillum pedocola]
MDRFMPVIRIVSLGALLACGVPACAPHTPSGGLTEMVDPAGAAAHPRLLLVTSLADDGSAGTLRAAILQNNQHPGQYRIRIAPQGPGPHVIRPVTPLPAIRGPVVIEGGSTSAALAPEEDALLRDVRGLDAPHPGVIIDGSRLLKTVSAASCPGEEAGNGPNVRSLQKAGLAIVDTHGVEIAGLEIRNFCIGILILRSSDNEIRDNRFVHQVGASGVLVSGDDGHGGATTGLATHNRLLHNSFIDNGDGFEFVRGADHGIARDNTVVATARTEMPSQGAEIFGSDDIELRNNRFSGYSDGIQAGGNRHRLLDNILTDNTNGITTSGTGTTIAGNLITANRLGVAPSGAMNVVTISRNAIYDNGRDILRCHAGGAGTLPGSTTCRTDYPKLGIDLGADGPTHNDGAANCADGLPDCDDGVNGLQNFPVLDAASSWSDGTVTIHGLLETRPDRAYVVEIYASRAAGYAGYGEGEVYLGSVEVRTDAAGKAFIHARFTGVVDPFGDGRRQAFFTATATDIASGASSEFSAALLLKASNKATDQAARQMRHMRDMRGILAQ